MRRDARFSARNRLMEHSDRRGFPAGSANRKAFAACLEREMLEELGVRVAVGRMILSVSHAYPEREVELHFFACDLLTEPRPLLGQEIKWVPRQELASLNFPPADRELITVLIAASRFLCR